MTSWHSSSAKHNRLRGGGLSREALAERCVQIVDMGLLAIIFVAPLFFGGRDAMGRMLFIVLSCVVGAAWFTRQALLNRRSTTRFSWSYAFAAACLAMLIVQLVPLPSDWLQRLAPRNMSLLPLWDANAESPATVGVWRTLSLTPSDTKLALATLIGYVMLFVTTLGRLRTTHEIQRLLRAMAVAAIAMAGFGLLQYFTSNGKFFWFYNYPYTDTFTRVKGSFTCSNHFVNYLVLCLGPMLAWIILGCSPQSAKRTRDWQASGTPLNITSGLLYLGLLVVVFAIVLSKSRGGALAFAVASVVCFGIYYFRGYISSGQMFGLTGVGLLVVGLLSIYGYDEVARRLDDFAKGSVEELDTGGGRRKIWKANLAAIEQGGLFGAGAGSHREIYPTYLPESLELTYTHAENGYLQIVTENGWLGASLLAIAILLVLSWCWRANVAAPSREQKILAGAVTASLLASLVHSMVDFVWFIPACMSLTVLLLACALRLSQLTYEQETKPLTNTAGAHAAKFAFAAAILLAGVWAGSVAVGPGMAAKHWNKYRLAASTGRQQTIKTLVTADQEIDELQQSEELTKAMIFHLRNTLRSDPDSAQAHFQLAAKYLRLFEQQQIRADNSMSVSQIRDAATASQFATATELQEWLTRAFGENSKLLYQSHYHACRAIQLCPLQGGTYLHLSDLCFLQGQGNASIDAYIDQGLLLRPFDFGVVFEVGEQLSVLGRDAEGLAHWQRIFRNRGKHQLRIIQVLSQALPGAAFLELFQPDWQTLPFVWQYYRQSQGLEAWQAIVTYATETARTETAELPPKQSVVIWRSLAGMYKDLHHLEGVLYCFQQAVRVAPTDYKARRELGRTLLQMNRFQEAQQHLQWCLTRRPHDDALKAEAIHASRQLVAGKTDSQDHPTTR